MDKLKIQEIEGLPAALAQPSVPDWLQLEGKDIPAGVTFTLFGTLIRTLQLIPAGTNPPPYLSNWPDYYQYHRARPDEETAGRLDVFDADLAALELALQGKSDSGHLHDDRYPTKQQVTTGLAGKADLVHQHTAAQVVDFTEAVQDAVAQLLRAGTAVSLVYDDANDTYTISAQPGTAFDPEQVRNVIGAAMLGIGLVSVAYDDASNTIAISTTATQNQTDAYLLSRANHTGTQAIDTVEGLSTALGNKVNSATHAALSSRVAGLEQTLQPGELAASKQDWAGLSIRAAVLRLINEGSATQPTTPAAPAAPADLVVDANGNVNWTLAAGKTAADYEFELA